MAPAARVYLVAMDQQQRVIIMHGMTKAEIDLVMRAAKKQLENPRDVIFAMTTENSLKMKVADLIEDLTEDHNYLKENPPEELTKKQ